MAIAPIREHTMPPLIPGNLVAIQFGTQDGCGPLIQAMGAVIKVLYRTTMNNRPLATVSGLDGLGHPCPTRLHLRLRHILVEQRFQNRPQAAHTGRPLLFTCDATTLSALTAARIIGHERRARPTERCAMPAIHRSGHGGVMGHAAHGAHGATTLDHERYTRHYTANWRPIRTALISFGYKRSVPPRCAATQG